MSATAILQLIASLLPLLQQLLEAVASHTEATPAQQAAATKVSGFLSDLKGSDFQS